MRTEDLTFLADEELARAVREGMTEAFGVLWERHAGAGRAAARRLTASFDPDDMVQEAYLRILHALQSGSGPVGAFRPYLYTTLRSVAANWSRSPEPLPVEDLPEVIDDRDVASEVLERSVTVRAFRRLPERWQSVLWYTEVEAMRPSEAAPLLGLSASATAALAYRAREGLRREWLQAHVQTETVAEECRWTVERLAGHARGDLSRAAQDRLEEHLTGCMACSILAEEIGDVASRLRLFLLPLVLGAPAALGFAAIGTVGSTSLETPYLGPLSPRRTAASFTKAPAAAVSTVLAVAAVAVMSGVVLARPWDEPEPPHVVASTGKDVGADSGFTGTPTVPTADVPALDGPTEMPPAAGEPAPHQDTRGSDASTGMAVPGDHRRGATSSPAPLVPPSHGAGLIPSAPTSFPSPVPSDPSVEPKPLTAPVVLEAPPAGALNFFPVIRGTGLPGAAIRVTSTDGFVSTTPAGADGTWSVALSGLAATEVHSLTVVQEQAGRVSSPSTTPLGPYTFELPRVVSPAPGATITGRVQERSGTEPPYAIDVEFAGAPGFVVEAFVDDRPTGNLHTLGAQPLVRQVSGLAPGKHTFGLRYVRPDAAGTSFGPMTAITFTVTAP